MIRRDWTRDLPSFVVALACALGVSLASYATPNPFFEFCTTRAYGFPFPWHVDWCLCEQRAGPTLESLFRAGNLVLSVGLALLVAWGLRCWRRGSKRPEG